MLRPDVALPALMQGDATDVSVCCVVVQRGSKPTLSSEAYVALEGHAILAEIICFTALHATKSLLG